VFAGAALVVAAVLAAATVNREGQGATGRTVLTDQGDPSDVAAQIIASAKGFNRDVDDLVPHDDPESPTDTRLESNYPQLAESIVKHGSGILYRLIHGAPEEQMEGIPMPVDDEEPPDADGLDADAGGEPPQTTPPPDPSADQGSLAESIIQDSNKAREENLADADINGEPVKVDPASVSVSWSNAGAEAENNAYNYGEDSAHKDPDDPARPLMGTAYAKGGRNYWRVNDAGENIDTKMVDGAEVQQLGALGGGYAPSSTNGLGPAVSEAIDNGALTTDQFTIDTSQDDGFHGSASSWLPIQTATEQTGATAADTGNGLNDQAYLSDFGKKGPSSKIVPGAALTVTDEADNAGAGEQFSISTVSADAFDCGDDCVQSPASVMLVDPDAPNAVDEVVGGPEEPAASPGSPLAEEEAAKEAAQGVDTAEAPAVPAAEKSAPQGLAMLPMGVRGDEIRQRRGPAGMSGSSGPAPI